MDTYTMSAYLVAQLGKNYAEDGGAGISGSDLLKLAWDKIKEIQYLGGDIVAFCFSQFDIRQNVLDTDEPHELVQLLRLL